MREDHRRCTESQRFVDPFARMDRGRMKRAAAAAVPYRPMAYAACAGWQIYIDYESTLFRFC